MNYLLSYDISNDKSRKRVSDYLLEKGFLRVQNSVFLGEIHITKIDDILENICLLVDKKSQLQILKKSFAIGSLFL